MALTPDQEEIIKKLAEAITDSGGSLGGGSAGGGTISKLSGIDTKDFRDALDLGENALKDYIKTTKATEKASGVLARHLDLLDKEISEETNLAKKSILEQKREIAARQNTVETTKQAGMAFAAGLGKAVGTVSASLASAGGNLVKSLQSGGNGFEVSSEALKAGADFVGSGTQAAGKGIKAVGGALMTTMHPATMAVGAALSGLGTIVDFAGEKLAKFAKFGVDVLSKEVEKTIKTFNESSAAGAMFADGMTGLRNAAGEAGVDTATFSNVLKTHSGRIAETGLGVTEGAKAIGRVGKIFDSDGKRMRTSMLKLGFGYEEQAQITADVIGDMTRLNPGQKINDAAVAEQTMKYAENLRTIAAITGEDAKKKMEESRAAANQLAFQQKLAKKTPAEQEKIMQAMSHMTAQQKQNFMDTVNFGSVINKNGAIMEAQLPAMADANRAAIAAMQNGTLDGTKMAQINAEHQDALKNQVMSADGLAQAGAALPGSLAEGLSKTMLETMQYVNKYTKEAVEKGLSGVEDQSKTTDKLTDSVVKAEEAAMGLKRGVEKMLTPAIAHYAEFTKTMLTSLDKMLDELNIGVEERRKLKNTQEQENVANQTGITDAQKAVIGKAVTERQVIESPEFEKWREEQFKKDDVGFFSRLLKGNSNSAQDETNKYGVRSYMNQQAVAPADGTVVMSPATATELESGKKAAGGIVSGPASGFLQQLDGTEAVVPLPNGNKIPVEFGPGLSETIKASMLDNSTLASALASIQQPTSIESPITSISTTLQSMFDGFKTAFAPPSTEPAQPSSQETDRLRETKIARDEQLEVLKQQLEMMKQFVDKADQLLSEARDQKSLTQGILNAAY
jgi:hypothetical protein